MKRPRTPLLLLGGLALLAFGPRDEASASSHREAPFVTRQPKIDGTDFYMFRSYEPGRADYVTLVACYLPLQDGYGGPNFFALDPDAIYEIHIDNNGDAREDLTFQFLFTSTSKDLALDIGPPGATQRVSVPLLNLGPIAPGNTAALNVEESYTLTLVRGDRRTGTKEMLARPGGQTLFPKPVDNIGSKSIADYAAYAATFLHEFTIPGCPLPGRVFVGQRKDPFVVNLGETFDLVNNNPLGAEDGRADDLADKNVTALCLELPISCLVSGADPVIGGWTTASLRQARVLNPEPTSDGSGKGPSVEGGAFVQQSRLGAPLINEVIIGLKDKDRFNASEPKDDAQFLTYVTHPTLPAILQVLFGVRAPTLFPRADLVQAFLTGVPGLNQPAGVSGAEILRLNTSIAPRPKGSQERLAVLRGDTAGFPNGRRPGDDVVDIELRVAMGVLLAAADAPDGQLAYTDGALCSDALFNATFPYLATPIPGSPNQD
ncbi:MAG: DUF4331 domain-containing protein [Planctomycetaceae bacterium]